MEEIYRSVEKLVNTKSSLKEIVDSIKNDLESKNGETFNVFLFKQIGNNDNQQFDCFLEYHADCKFEIQWDWP